MDTLFAICPTYAVDEGQATEFLLVRKEPDGSNKRWPILITREGNSFFGFKNACPHEGTALDRIPGEFMDEDDNFIECGKHQAKCDLDTGMCFIGPCRGKSLPSIELVIDDGDICLRGIELAEEDGLDISDADEMPKIAIASDGGSSAPALGAVEIPQVPSRAAFLRADLMIPQLFPSGAVSDTSRFSRLLPQPEHAGFSEELTNSSMSLPHSAK